MIRQGSPPGVREFSSAATEVAPRTISLISRETVSRMSARRFKRGDLVQLHHEYVVGGNPSLFRIRRIHSGVATLGQLSTDSDGFCGVDTDVELDDPDLIEPHAEILQMYSRHVR